MIEKTKYSQKIAIYIRVSTDKQDYENQIYQLEEYAKKQDWDIVKVYKEVISGKEKDRPEFKKMLQDASKKEFDAILVWALDRFTREGTEAVWRYFSLLDSYKVKFISYQEPYLRTDNELARSILISVMGALAKQERIRISERTKAGQDRARRAGKKIGKPEIPMKVKKSIIKLREQGKNYREICNEVHYWDASNNKHKVSMGLVHKVLKNFKRENIVNKPVQITDVI